MFKHDFRKVQCRDHEQELVQEHKLQALLTSSEKTHPNGGGKRIGKGQSCCDHAAKKESLIPLPTEAHCVWRVKVEH